MCVVDVREACSTILFTTVCKIQDFGCVDSQKLLLSMIIIDSGPQNRSPPIVGYKELVAGSNDEKISVNINL